MIPKHLNSNDLGRLLANHRQQDKYLDYYQNRMDFWYSVLMAETDPEWMEVAYQNFMMVAERMDYLFDLFS